MTINWNEWNQDIVKAYHGDLDYYRKLYKGDHAELFARAKHLIEKGEIMNGMQHGVYNGKKVQPPYIIANISKIIAEIPARFISQSIGNIKSSITSTEEQNEEANDETSNLIEGGEGAANQEITNLQDELIKQIEKNSKLKFEHWRNLVQHQIDGGLVGVPWKDERGLRIEFKSRDVYYEHEDGNGCDLVYDRTFRNEEDEEQDFVHVYREREEVADNGEPYLQANHYLYSNAGGKLELVEEDEARDLLKLDELETVYKGRSRRFVCYIANDKTFIDPYGVSALVNQGPNQDEVNWTLTRRAIIFERNGKPRIAIHPDAMQLLQDAAEEKFGDRSLIDADSFEMFTLGPNGEGMEIYQIDVSKIGDIEWVKEVVRLMLLTTNTSQKAVDFLSQDGGGAESGKAKFYDLMTTIIKSTHIQAEYVEFLKQLFENCLWLANQDDSNIIIEQPDIELTDMIPASRMEVSEGANASYTAGTLSLEEAIRRSNPFASEEWIEEELTRIEEGKQGDDSNTLALGRQAMSYYTDNRNPLTGETLPAEGDE